MLLGSKHGMHLMQSCYRQHTFQRCHAPAEYSRQSSGRPSARFASTVSSPFSCSRQAVGRQRMAVGAQRHQAAAWQPSGGAADHDAAHVQPAATHIKHCCQHCKASELGRTCRAYAAILLAKPMPRPSCKSTAAAWLSKTTSAEHARALPSQCAACRQYAHRGDQCPGHH